MINRKHLEILLSKHVSSFSEPKIELEQYQTPPRVAANLLHFAANQGDIIDKKVIDLCAGTGILGLGASILGAEVTLVEIDPDAATILQKNALDLECDVEILIEDVFKLNKREFDTALINPPFGIQQKNQTDLDYLGVAAELTKNVYSIHDGSPANEKQLPELLREIFLDPQGYYLDEFPQDQVYPWHTLKRKIHKVMVIHSVVN